MSLDCRTPAGQPRDLSCSWRQGVCFLSHPAAYFLCACLIRCHLAVRPGGRVDHAMAAGALFRQFLRAAHHSGLNFPGHQSAACCWTRRVNVLSRLWAGWVCSRAVVCRSESDKFTTRRHQYTCGLSSLPSAVWLVVQWRFSIATLVDAERRFYSV